VTRREPFRPSSLRTFDGLISRPSSTSTTGKRSQSRSSGDRFTITMLTASGASDVR